MRLQDLKRELIRSASFETWPQSGSAGGHGRHTIFQIRTEQFILGGSWSSAIGDLDLRKPSHRPVDILPNARREVSSGLRCIRALRPFCLDTHWRAPAWPRSPGRADSTQIPDPPAAFLKSCRGYLRRPRSARSCPHGGLASKADSRTATRWSVSTIATCRACPCPRLSAASERAQSRPRSYVLIGRSWGLQR